MQFSAGWRGLVLGVGLLGTVAGCSVVAAPRTLRGDLVDRDALTELVPGTSTTKDVESLLGSPTSRAAFDNNRWIYIAQTTHTRIGRYPGVDKQQVVVLNFDQNGVLRNVEEHGLRDSKAVAMAGGTTPSPGSEASFLQQLLGNIGKYNPGGGALGGQTPGGSGVSVGNHEQQ